MDKLIAYYEDRIARCKEDILLTIKNPDTREYRAKWIASYDAEIAVYEETIKALKGLVAVKALEWVASESLGVNYEAKTAFGIYRVFRRHKVEGWRWSFSHDVDSNFHNPNYPGGDAATEADAKAGAQADCETRVQSFMGVRDAN